MFLFSCKHLRFYITSFLFSLLLIFILLLIIQNAPHTAVDSAGAGEDRIGLCRAFLYACGWQTSPSPEVSSVLIPAQFNETYRQYNDLQRAQGYDLTAYRGKEAEKYVFRILNYPGQTPEDAPVQATVLVYEGHVIGGDICSVRIDGFMHGFSYETE